MNTPLSELPELSASESQLQRTIDQFVSKLDQNRITIPDGVLSHINASAPDPEDLAIVLAWNGRVFNPDDHEPRDAIKAVASLPYLGEDVTSWWLDQVDDHSTRHLLQYQLILSGRTPRPSRTTLAAFGIIRSVLSLHQAAIPTLDQIHQIAGPRLSKILFTYARLRHIATAVASATFPPIPKPELAASMLATAYPNLIVDIGRIDYAHQMAASQTWRGHDVPPAVCPTCDVWIANDMLDVHHSSAYGCPYCWRTPIIDMTSDWVPPPENPVDLIFHQLAPTPYSESGNIYRRVAVLSALTPSQAHAIMNDNQVAVTNPEPCWLRASCPTDCGLSPLPLTNSGTNEDCLVVPFLQRAVGMNNATKTEYAQQYIQDVRDQRSGQRRNNAKARQLHSQQPQPADNDVAQTPAPRQQPTLL